MELTTQPTPVKQLKTPTYTRRAIDKYREKNKEKVDEMKKNYAEEHKEKNKQYIREYMRTYYHLNRDKLNERKKELYRLKKEEKLYLLVQNMSQKGL